MTGGAGLERPLPKLPVGPSPDRSMRWLGSCLTGLWAEEQWRVVVNCTLARAGKGEVIGVRLVIELNYQ